MYKRAVREGGHGLKCKVITSRNNPIIHIIFPSSFANFMINKTLSDYKIDYFFLCHSSSSSSQVLWL